MAASSMLTRAPFLAPLARHLLPSRARLVCPPAKHNHLCSRLQLLRHCASSSSPSCERAQRLPSCAPRDDGEPAAQRGCEGDESDGAGAQDKGVTGPAAAPTPTMRAARAGRRRPGAPPVGRPDLPRQSGGGKIHAADAAQAKRAQGRGRRRRPSPPPGPPREGPGGGGGVIHSVPPSSSDSSSAS